jgi:hypothetical protein
MAGNVFKPQPRAVARSASSSTSWAIGLSQIAATFVALALAIQFGSIRTEPHESVSRNLTGTEAQLPSVTGNRLVATPSPKPALPRPRGDTRFRIKSLSARPPNTLELPVQSGPASPRIVRECSSTDLQLRQCAALSVPDSANNKFHKKGVS